ncbi:MAG: tripartite tricarboxylate transporter permease [Euryarchaeota archaeon]|nr:tripartite tricarboxylate transporter permease [Euryarchaeota archaeon]
MMDLLLLCAFCLLGILIGMISGLVPGIHVNNIALLLLSFSGVIITAFSFLVVLGISDSFILVLICAFMVAITFSQIFFSFIPTTFLGAPQEDTALSVLPAHALLLQGRGYEAVTLSAIGTFSAIFLCFILLYPLKFIIGEPLNFYATLQEIMVWVLLAIVVLMICTEKGKITQFGGTGKTPYFIGIAFATFIFLISGAFGLVVFRFSLESPLGLPASVLFPALAGLFGMPSLLTSLLEKSVIPPQIVEPPVFKSGEKKSFFLSVLVGSIAGVFVPIIPGISSSTGTVVAMTVRGHTDQRQTLVTLSAVNTSAAFSVLIMLFLIQRTRSGVTIAINELIPVENWTSILMPANLLYLLIALLFTCMVSYFLCLKVARVAARSFAAIPYTRLVVCTILAISVLVFLFTGFFGLIILAVASCIGLLPVLWGVRRSHCMGVLLIPVILYFL